MLETWLETASHFSSSADQEFVSTPYVALLSEAQEMSTWVCSEGSSVYCWGLPQSKSGIWHLQFHQFDPCPLLLKCYMTFSHHCYTPYSKWWKFFRECGEKKPQTLNKVWHSLKLHVETLQRFREFGRVIFILSSSVQFLLCRFYLNVSDCIKHCYYCVWSCTALLLVVKYITDCFVFFKSNTFLWHFSDIITLVIQTSCCISTFLHI